MPLTVQHTGFWHAVLSGLNPKYISILTGMLVTLCISIHVVLGIPFMWVCSWPSEYPTCALVDARTLSANYFVKSIAFLAILQIGVNKLLHNSITCVLDLQATPKQ